ncbi:MAG TPA: anti-sigma factor [Blastocatellia bacterium]|nr:anti-sigma factor [Blastocatellia bacterium]
MKHQGITEESQTTAALYALGALSQHEAQSFENHLSEGCAVCTDELTEFQVVAGTIGLGSAEATPPAYMRDLLNSRIEKEAQTSSAIVRFPEQVKPVSQPPAAPRRSFGQSFLPWAVAATVALVAIVSFLAWQDEKQRASSARQQLAALQSESAELRAQADRQAIKAQEIEQINAVLTAGNSEVIPLKVDPAYSAKIYWDRQKNRWLVAVDLPRPPEGKGYQLWFVTPDAKISAGMIKTDETGHGFNIVDIPPAIGTVAFAAITVEPESGSEQPTSPIYAIGKVG